MANFGADVHRGREAEPEGSPLPADEARRDVAAAVSPVQYFTGDDSEYNAEASSPLLQRVEVLEAEVARATEHSRALAERFQAAQQNADRSLIVIQGS